ncbi:RNA ligase RtcB family protein [Clostridium sediminicola]|uniref:RNA ligase RtcB family protein n=1 Tax=Clostridium sediminicola TaxID=3114879 RepID=UPI0031F21FE5
MTTEIKIIRSEKSWIESSAVEQLEKVAKLEGMVQAVGMPDLHPGKTPVGASFVTKGIIYPHLIGNDIGCGMTLFSTGIKERKFKKSKVIEKLKKLDSLDDIDISDIRNETEYTFKNKLGTIGGGNHFAEFQKVKEIFDEEAVKNINLEKDKIMLLVHSGSRSFGEHILRMFIDKYSCQNGLKVGSVAFQEYMSTHNTAIEFSRLNRELVAYRLMSYLNKDKYSKLLNSEHNSLTEKVVNGEKIYVHRKGAAPSDVGYVVVAGSRGSKSYIVQPIGNPHEFAYSIAHGAGRKWNRISCKEKLLRIYSKKDVRLNNLNSSVICKDKSLLYQEAPEAYKNIEKVIEDMLNAKMIKLIASLEPLITYKV